MATYVPPKKNTALIFYLSLDSYSVPGVKQANPTLAAGDVQVAIDGGAYANLATLPTVTPAAGKGVKVSLSAAEMNGDNIHVVFSDQTAPPEWCDMTVSVPTAARQIDDLAYPATSGRSMVVDAAGLVDANAVKIGPTGAGSAQTARDVGASVLLSAGSGAGQLDFTSGVVKASLAQILGTALTETAGQIAAGFKKVFDVAAPVFTAASVNQTGDNYARIGAPAGASVSADVAAIKALLPAALVGGRIDASVGAVAANAITAAAIADGAIDRATFAADTGLQTVRSGTAQAGAAGSVTLDASASATTDFYKGMWVYLTGATGAGQVRLITAYNGGTKVASVAPNWATAPDVTSTFAILPVNGVDNELWLGGLIPAVSVTGVPLVDVADWKGATAPAMTGDAFARLGAPAGASVSADIAAVKVDTAAVKVQTDKLAFTVANQVDANVLDWKSATAPAMTGDAFARLGAPAGASVSADIAATKALLPTALVGGRIDASVGAVAANAITAAAIADAAIDRATFAVDTGLQTVRSNTAAAGAAGTITLDASASAVDSFYKGMWVYLTGATGAGQVRLITAYVGSTKVASVAPNWVTNPDNTSTFAILPVNAVDVELWLAGVIPAPNVTGVPKVDVVDWLGTAPTTPATAGNVVADVKKWNGTAVPAENTAGYPIVTVKDGTGTGEIDTSSGVVLARDHTGAALATAAALASVQSDTDDIQTRLPAALVSGRIDASVGAVAANAITAAAIADAAIDRATFAADTGLASIRSNTAQAGAAGTITLDAAASAVNDFYKGAWVLLTGATGVGQVRQIVSYVGATKVATITPNWVTNPDVTSTFAILPTAAVDIGLWGNAAVNALISGRVDVSAGAIAANVITAAAIAADAITAAKVADGTIDAATFAAGAINAAAIAADAITDAKVASDVTIASVTGAVGSVTGAVGSVTGNVGGNVTGSVGSVAAGGIAAASFAAGAINAAAIAADAIGASELAADAIAEIADGVWDELLSGHAGAGSAGAALTASGAAGDPWSTAIPGAYGAGTAGHRLGNVPDLVAGAAGGLFIAGSNAATTVNITGSLSGSVGSVTAGVTLAASAVTAIWAALTSALTTVGSIGKLIVDNLNATVGSRATQTSVDTIDDYVDTEVAAIKAVTDALPNAGALTTIQSDLDDIQTRLPAALVGGRMDASVGAMAANVLTAAATAADFGTEVAAAVWDRLTSALTAVGSVGKLIVDFLDVAVSSRLAAAGYTAPLTAAGVRSAVGLAAANLDTQLDALPTNAELATALGTADDAVLAQIALVKLQTDNLPSDPADQSLVIAATDAVMARLGAPAGASLAADIATRATPAQVNAEVVDAINVDTYAAPGQGVPPATNSLVGKVGYLHKAWRNKTDQTGSTYRLFADGGATVDHKATVTDDGTTFVRGEVASGP